MPTFTRHVTLHGKEDGWRLGNNVINALLLLVTGVTVILGLIFARPLVSVYAHSFAAVPGKLELTTELARVMMPFRPWRRSPPRSWACWNSLRHYFVPALAPATFNVVAIVFRACRHADHADVRAAAHHGAGHRGGGRRTHAGPVAVADPAQEGFAIVRCSTSPIRACDRCSLLMGPGNTGLAATQVNLFVSTLLASARAPAPSRGCSTPFE